MFYTDFNIKAKETSLACYEPITGRGEEIDLRLSQRHWYKREIQTASSWIKTRVIVSIPNGHKNCYTKGTLFTNMDLKKSMGQLDLFKIISV